MLVLFIPGPELYLGKVSYIIQSRKSISDHMLNPGHILFICVITPLSCENLEVQVEEQSLYHLSYLF